MNVIIRTTTACVEPTIELVEQDENIKCEKYPKTGETVSYDLLLSSYVVPCLPS